MVSKSLDQAGNIRGQSSFYGLMIYRILQGIESIVHCAVTPNDELSSGALYHCRQEEEYGPMVTEVNWLRE